MLDCAQGSESTKMQFYLPVILAAMVNVTDQNLTDLPQGRLPSLPESRVDNDTTVQRDILWYDPVESGTSIWFLFFSVLMSAFGLA
tara:strand:+ start:102 stop:359 length:258 start_codon:yes stop_codon:yes gene_type:complete